MSSMKALTFYLNGNEKKIILKKIVVIFKIFALFNELYD